MSFYEVFFDKSFALHYIKVCRKKILQSILAISFKKYFPCLSNPPIDHHVSAKEILLLVLFEILLEGQLENRPKGKVEYYHEDVLTYSIHLLPVQYLSVCVSSLVVLNTWL